VGTGVSRIEQEFILTAVQERSILLQVHGNRQEATGRIQSVTDEEVVIELDLPIKTGRDERLRVFFSYFGQVMTFLARVRSNGGDAPRGRLSQGALQEPSAEI